MPGEHRETGPRCGDQHISNLVEYSPAREESRTKADKGKPGCQQHEGRKCAECPEDSHRTEFRSLLVKRQGRADLLQLFVCTIGAPLTQRGASKTRRRRRFERFVPAAEREASGFQNGRAIARVRALG